MYVYIHIYIYICSIYIIYMYIIHIFEYPDPPGLKNKSHGTQFVSFSQNQDTELIAHVGLDLSCLLHILLWHLSVVDVALEASLWEEKLNFHSA